MSDLADLKIYLTHEKMVLTNDRGFRIEFDIPTPGNIVVCHVGTQSFHFGIYPPNPLRSPTVSDLESDDSSQSSTVPSGSGGPPRPYWNLTSKHSIVYSTVCIYRIYFSLSSRHLQLLLPRLVKILDNSHHSYGTMRNIVIVCPSVRLFVTFVNDINKSTYV